MNEMFNSLWIEKYRPSLFNEVVLSEDNRKLIDEFKNKGEIPNLLLWGHPGTGKSTLAKVIVNDILKCQYLYINASDKNGIDVIRNEVSNFAQTKSFDGKQKVIILDEFCGVTIESQRCLRNVMEEYASVTRFILTANYLNRIIPAIQSRCQSIEVVMPFNNYAKRCLEIIKKENIKVGGENTSRLIPWLKTFYPDLRKAINNIQKNSVGGELVINDTNEKNNLVNKIYDDILKKNNLFDLRKYIIEHEIDFANDYYSLLKGLFEVVFEDANILAETKRDFLVIIYDHMYKYNFVMDKEINFYACILAMAKNIL